VLACAVGVIDIILAIVLLAVHPHPLTAAYCCLWGFATALMRPLSGESWMQFVERSGNFLPALALVYMQAHSKQTDYAFETYVALIGAGCVAMFLGAVFLRMTGVLADAPASKKAM
jgi:hypothetical protein